MPPRAPSDASAGPSWVRIRPVRTFPRTLWPLSAKSPASETSTKPSPPTCCALAGRVAHLEEVARGMARVGAVVAPPGREEIGGAGAAAPMYDAPETLFRAKARLVEVHTIVPGDRGRYVDDLPADQFVIRESGKPV